MRRRMRNWKKITWYMLLPEDTTGLSSQEEWPDSLSISNLPPYLGVIKGIFWLILAIVGPLIPPVLMRAITGN